MDRDEVTHLAPARGGHRLVHAEAEPEIAVSNPIPGVCWHPAG